MSRTNHDECGTCGYPAFRADAHASWCWSSRGEPYPWPSALAASTPSVIRRAGVELEAACGAGPRERSASGKALAFGQSASAVRSHAPLTRPAPTS